MQDPCCRGFFCDSDGMLRTLNTVQEYHEFVAADPSDGIRAAHAASQAPGRFAQQLVTHLVAQTIVHLLEVVEVDIQHRQLLAFAPGQGYGGMLAVVQQVAVGQCGELIVQGDVLKTGFCLLAFDRGGDLGRNKL